jgi:signal transduction histidine kinase
MTGFRSLSIRRKLIAINMAISVAALLLACTGFAYYEIRAFRRTIADEIGSIAQIVSRSSEAAVAFRDAKAAGETLAVLKAEPRIVAGCLFDGTSSLLADYHRPGGSRCPSRSPAGSAPVFSDTTLSITQPVIVDGQRAGTVYLVSDLADMQRRLGGYAVISAWVLAAAVLLALLLSAFLQNLISGPISHLAETASRVSAGGNYTIRACKTADDELGLLVDRFNDMLEQIHERDIALQAAQDELEARVEERTRELQGEITQHKHTQAKLVAAKEAAEDASRAKSAFLANMSHELRTPLNAVIGYSEMLQEEAEDTGQQAFIPDLEKIATAGRHLLALISDILDISKIEARRMELRLERIHIGDLIEEVMVTVGPMATRNRNRLRVQCPDPEREMVADLTKFRQSLLNLLSNACKFTEDGEVTLTVSEDTEGGRPWIRWRVRDTGIGIPPEAAGKLFQSFSQVDASSTRKYGGTGLGLAISQRLCQLMGGNITLESIPGTGSEFTIHLPLPENAA